MYVAVYCCEFCGCSLNNYMHVLQQWPLLQPDSRKGGVVNGSVRYVSPELCIMQRVNLKEVSDEHGEAMHRQLLAIRHNQGGGKAMPTPGTLERESICWVKLGCICICSEHQW